MSLTDRDPRAEPNNSTACTASTYEARATSLRQQPANGSGFSCESPAPRAPPKPLSRMPDTTAVRKAEPGSRQLQALVGQPACYGRILRQYAATSRVEYSPSVNLMTMRRV